jgi:CHASE3 domain sensor protein
MRPINLLRVTLALNIVVTIVAMTLAYRALRHADDSGRLVVRSHWALQAAEETLRRAVDAETGTRGFMISRNPADLAPYNRALETIRGPMENLATILREDRRQEDADRLRAQIDAMFTMLVRMVERTRAGDNIDASTRDAANVNMAGLRETVRGIRQTETDVLDARILVDDAAAGRVKRLAIATTGLATALLTLIVGLLVFVARPERGVVECNLILFARSFYTKEPV